MHNFFAAVNAGHPEGGSRYLDDIRPLDLENFSHGSWASTGLPPNFEGSETSLSHEYLRPQTFSSIGLAGVQDEVDPSSALASPDVVSAAQLLFRNGQTHDYELGNSNHRRVSANATLFGQTTSDPIPYGTHATAPTHRNSFGGRPESLRSNSYTHGQPSFSNQTPLSAPPYFEQMSRNAAEDFSSSRAGHFHWGSDSNFHEDQAYLVPPHQETEEDVTQGLMQNMACLQSATTTRPSSPNVVRQSKSKSRRQQQSPLDADSRTKSENSVNDDEKSSRPRKRRKTSIKTEDVDSDLSDAAEDAAKKRKSKKKQTSPFPEEGSVAKRRKSSGNAQKNNRENLSEKQKRENHILSEQKRRNLIKQGFADLCELVPDLRTGGFSKSAILVQAASWLETILKENEELRRNLDLLEGAS